MRIVRYVTLLLLIITGCSHSNTILKSEESVDSSSLPVLKEVFHTSRDEGENVDSPAVWHGPDDTHLLMATAKEGHSILVFNAITGDYISTVGTEGTGELQFQRPNGIWVIDDLMLVVERDNARIQVISLPDFGFVGFITHEDLRYPYGLSAEKTADHEYELYITDNFNPALEGFPPEEELDERIHHYRFEVRPGGTFSFETLNLFGDIYGEGILHKVESLHADRQYNRLLIADEAFSQRSIKIYDLDGNFTGTIIPNRYFSSEPEGIALYECPDGSGYWIATDQHKTEENRFMVFDRESLEFKGGFRGEITRNTDGIWLSQKSFGPFGQGLFYAVHDDGSVTAFSWSDISQALSLEISCSQS